MRNSELKNNVQNTRLQRGQVVIVLTLIMLVVLTVGIAISQRSISDISISSKTEQSSRAFSAAEAGIEKALQQGANISADGISLTLDNNSDVFVKTTGDLPIYSQALEYPPIGKPEFAHFWLTKSSDMSAYYTQDQVYLYFGNGGTDPDTGFDPGDNKPAVEVNLVTQDSSGTYISTRSYFDSDSTRIPSNNFLATDFPCAVADNRLQINTSGSSNYPTPADRAFYCRASINTRPNSPAEIPILLRVRILYSNKKQRLAVAPKLTGCNTGAFDTSCSLPPQANIYTSVGHSGETERRVQIFQMKNVVPQFLDFAIFSNSNIQK